MHDTPIYSALIEYAQGHNLRLHMPGHVGGKGMPPELETIAGLDVTEIPGLDDLHLSQDIIEEARQLLARAFGASESLFLVNGATSGIHALLMSVCSDGDKIMIPRNAHRSFYGAMVLTGACPIYIPCEIEPELGIAVTVKPETIDGLLDANSDVTAIFLGSPSYYGSSCDIARIVQVAKGHGKCLLVDEAHGAHFPFHAGYPSPALQEGAAAVVNGLHKTLPVLNQGACLHLSPDFMNLDKLWSAYSMLTTTSPSYPILASIDWARSFMETQGSALLEKAQQYAREFKTRIDGIKGIRTCTDNLLNVTGVKAVDPLKVLISVQGLSLNGYQVADLLRKKYHIQVELAEPNVILTMFSFLHEREAWQQLYQALKDIAADYISVYKNNYHPLMLPHPHSVLSPRRAFMSQKRKIRLGDSRGEIAGEMIAAYPPGIPCILPGEMITGEIIEYIEELKIHKIHIQGAHDAHVEYINVIEKLQ